MSIEIEDRGAVRIVTLDRPERRNAVDPATARQLYEAFVTFETDADLSVAVLTGRGGAFSAGFDLKHFSEALDESWDAAHAFPDDWDDRPIPQPILGPMGPTRLRLSKPVIAAVAGPAVAGGMELALWCDLRVVEPSAYFGVYSRRWGVPYIDGGTVRLPRLVGQGRALEMMLTGRQVPAEEALRIGLAERAAPEGGALETAVALAEEIARFPQGCLRADRSSVLDQWGLSEAAAIRREWDSLAVFHAEGQAGAGRFAAGKGRGGDFSDFGG
jgi:enoyl-CoA hydratase